MPMILIEASNEKRPNEWKLGEIDNKCLLNLVSFDKTNKSGK